MARLILHLSVRAGQCTAAGFDWKEPAGTLGNQDRSLMLFMAGHIQRLYYIYIYVRHRDTL